MLLEVSPDPNRGCPLVPSQSIVLHHTCPLPCQVSLHFTLCFSSVEQRSSISKQNSFQTGSNLSFSCGEPRVPLWLQSSEDMEKCSKGRVEPLPLPVLVLPDPRGGLHPGVFVPSCPFLPLLLSATHHVVSENTSIPWLCVQVRSLGY